MSELMDRAQAALEGVTELLEAHKFGPEGKVLFGPDSLQDIRRRLEVITGTECDCGTGPHEDALHDLADDDVPALLWVVEAIATRLAALEQAVTRVRELHRKCGCVSHTGLVDVCVGCHEPYPCPTIRALDGTEAP